MELNHLFSELQFSVFFYFYIYKQQIISIQSWIFINKYTKFNNFTCVIDHWTPPLYIKPRPYLQSSRMIDRQRRLLIGRAAVTHRVRRVILSLFTILKSTFRGSNITVGFYFTSEHVQLLFRHESVIKKNRRLISVSQRNSRANRMKRVYSWGKPPAVKWNFPRRNREQERLGKAETNSRWKRNWLQLWAV